MLRLVAILYAILIVSGCNRLTGGKKSSIHTSSEVASDQCLQVVNGSITQAYPSVGFLVNAHGACTGTFIGHNVMIAATHCLNPADPGNIFVITENAVNSETLDAYEKIQPLAVLYSGNLGAQDLNQMAFNTQKELEDLAIILFPDNSAPATSKIHPGTPDDGAKAQVVGYGLTSLPGDLPVEPVPVREKRVGKNNHTYSSPEFVGENIGDISGVLALLGNPDQGGKNRPELGALASSGDSGGPIFVGDAVAGVASVAGRFNSDQTGGDATISGISIYVDLNSAASRNLLKKAQLEGAAFELPEGGPGPSESNADVQSEKSGCSSGN